MDRSIQWTGPDHSKMKKKTGNEMLTTKMQHKINGKRQVLRLHFFNINTLSSGVFTKYLQHGRQVAVSHHDYWSSSGMK